MPRKIAFFDAKSYDKKFFSETNERFGFELTFYKGHLTTETLPLVVGYDAVCLFVNDLVNAEMVQKLKKANIRLILLRCAGYNNIDLQAAYGSIHVLRVPAYSPYAVAEHATALILALNRKIAKAVNRTQDSNFTLDGLLGFDLHGKTVGVIGTGQIGKVMIRILSGFGMRILAYDPFPDPDYARQNGFAYASLDEIYAQSDIITLHCPLTQETMHLINASSIAKMKEGVMLINTSRGKLIDTKALIQGLKKRKIGYAGLDVYEEESEYFFEDYSTQIVDDDTLARLLTFPNVIVTSHQAFFTREALANIAETTLQNCADFFEGKPLKNEICYQCGQNTANCAKGRTGRCFP
jgi:D-lactate dehydrogenase